MVSKFITMTIISSKFLFLNLADWRLSEIYPAHSLNAAVFSWLIMISSATGGLSSICSLLFGYAFIFFIAPIFTRYLQDIFGLSCKTMKAPVLFQDRLMIYQE